MKKVIDELGLYGDLDGYTIKELITKLSSYGEDSKIEIVERRDYGYEPVDVITIVKYE